MTRRIVQSGGIEFEALQQSELDPVFVVAQCLDNQWVPRELLRQMIDSDLALDHDLVASSRAGLVRTEYLRALVNARQLVANRAYLYNNPVVFKDYMQQGGSRDAFKDFLSSGVIVPYLYSERTPREPPSYTTDPRGFPAWQRLCEEARMKCVRLSWEEDENQTLIRSGLARRFHDFAATAYTGDTKLYARDLGLDPRAANALKAQLKKMAIKCIELEGPEQLARREDLYKEFVTAGEPAKGQYDKRKPFAGEIKQLLDLCYNTNLPDTLGGYALTPIDSLQRTALQEWQAAQQEQEISADQILELLRRSEFALVQEGLYVESLGSLMLKDVQEVRLTDEWARYIQSMDELLRDPFNFPHPDKGAASVYDNYVKLAGVITRLVAKKKADARTAKWTPVIEFVGDITGAVLSVVWSGAGVGYKLAGGVSSRAAGKAARFVGRLIIRGASRLGGQADLVVSVDFMRGRMQHAREQWAELQGRLSEITKFEVLPPGLEGKRDATINYPGAPNAQES